MNQRGRFTAVYVTLVGVPVLILLAILRAGDTVRAPVVAATTAATRSGAAVMPNLSTLLFQVAVVIVAARVVGWVFRRLGQPQVVGEMIAGIVLGPSLLGWLAPSLSARLFPPASLGFLSALSQIGLVAFMFLVGLELNPRQLRGRHHVAVVTSHASIILPFVLGSLLALFLYPRLSNASVTFTEFALFNGIAMSITAFPVLAHILRERNMMRHPVGAIALACAAVDDVTAWCVLGGVVALVRATGSGVPPWLTVLGVAAYTAFMLKIARPQLARFATVFHERGRVTADMMALILVLVLASAWVTEWLGVHALFGAFLFGFVMPKDPAFVRDTWERMEYPVVLLLLPLFFAFTGLRTSVRLLESSEMWLYTGLILVVAIAGKLGGSMFAARLTGAAWREAAAVGVLMNTRGLVQLVVLSVGLDIGVINQTLFTMMVLMAIVTTLLTSPLLSLVYPKHLLEADEEAAVARRHA